MNILDRAWNLLKARGTMRASDLGWELFEPGREHGRAEQNKYSRTALKLLYQLETQGRATKSRIGDDVTWHPITPKTNEFKLE